MNASAAAIAGGTGSTRRARCHVDPGCSRLLCCIQSDEPGSWLHTVQHSQPLRLLPEAYRYFRAHATDEQLLEKLSLESLSITSLLKEIGSLEKLRELQLGDNPDLQTLPRELATRKLTTLRLARTDNLTSFHFPNKFLKRLHEVYRKDIQAQCLDNDRYASVVLALREMSNFNFEQLEPVKKACKNYDGEQGAPESHIPSCSSLSPSATMTLSTTSTSRTERATPTFTK